MTELEQQAGTYHEFVRNSGHPNSKGWSVSKSRQGKWRIQLCSLIDGRPYQVEGTYTTKVIAVKVARDMVARLREGAA